MFFILVLYSYLVTDVVLCCDDVVSVCCYLLSPLYRAATGGTSRGVTVGIRANRVQNLAPGEQQWCLTARHTDSLHHTVMRSTGVRTSNEKKKQTQTELKATTESKQKRERSIGQGVKFKDRIKV